MSVATLERKTVAPALPVQERDPTTQFERYDTIDTSKIALVGFLSAIVTFAIIVAIQAGFHASDRVEVERKFAENLPTALSDAYTNQQTHLAGYGWVDPAKDMVHIPIDDAMKLVVADHQARKTVTE